MYYMILCLTVKKMVHRWPKQRMTVRTLKQKEDWRKSLKMIVILMLLYLKKILIILLPLMMPFQILRTTV